jgi:hypothetical protein
MQKEQKYSIILTGIKEGEDQTNVKSRIAKIVKRDVATVEKMLFSKKETVIKEGIPLENCKKIKVAFESAGATCRIQEENVKKVDKTGHISEADQSSKERDGIKAKVSNSFQDKIDKTRNKVSNTKSNIKDQSDKVIDTLKIAAKSTTEKAKKIDFKKIKTKTGDLKSKIEKEDYNKIKNSLKNGTKKLFSTYIPIEMQQKLKKFGLKKIIVAIALCLILFWVFSGSDENASQNAIFETQELKTTASNLQPIVLMKTERTHLFSWEGQPYLVTCELIYKGGEDLIWRLALFTEYAKTAFLENALLKNGLEVLKKSTKKCIEWSVVAAEKKTGIEKKVITEFDSGVEVAFSANKDGQTCFMKLINPSWVSVDEQLEILPFLIPNRAFTGLMFGYSNSQTLEALLKRLEQAKEILAKENEKRMKKENIFK